MEICFSRLDRRAIFLLAYTAGRRMKQTLAKNFSGTFATHASYLLRIPDPLFFSSNFFFYINRRKYLGKWQPSSQVWCLLVFFRLNHHILLLLLFLNFLQFRFVGWFIFLSLKFFLLGLMNFLLKFEKVKSLCCPSEFFGSLHVDDSTAFFTDFLPHLTGVSSYQDCPFLEKEECVLSRVKT